MSHTLSYLGQLDAKQLTTEYGQNGAILKASEQMEAHFLQSVLKQMRSATDALAVDSEDNPLSGAKDSVFRDFYDAELAQQLATSSNSGLAQQMAQQLSPKLVTASSVETPVTVATEIFKSDQDVVALDEYRQASAMQPTLLQINQGDE